MAKKASGEEEKTLWEKLHYPKCVENGCWAQISRPRPKGPLMLKLKEVDANLSRRIKDDGVMSFHLTGCTGHYGIPAPGQAVAEAMAAQAKDARAGGGSEAAKAVAFFFHLGDMIYKDPDKENPEREDMQKLFNEQFYTTYKDYPQRNLRHPRQSRWQNQRQRRKISHRSLYDEFLYFKSAYFERQPK